MNAPCARLGGRQSPTVSPHLSAAATRPIPLCIKSISHARNRSVALLPFRFCDGVARCDLTLFLSQSCMLIGRRGCNGRRCAIVGACRFTSGSRT